MIDDVQERSHYYLKSVVLDKGTLEKGYQKTEQLKDEVFEVTKEALQNLSSKMEDLETDYYRKLRKLNENNK